ncbi:MAG: hypothetical protein PHE88_12435 [Elusimicrobia bacterium]|nr:hypothetical protein [Elusimicrobiota bacterium]
MIIYPPAKSWGSTSNPCSYLISENTVLDKIMTVLAIDGFRYIRYTLLEEEPYIKIFNIFNRTNKKG